MAAVADTARRTTMIELTLEMAERAAKAALDEARALGTVMTASVVDEAGRLVLTMRGDGAGFLTTETSRAKAVAAASFRKETRELGEMLLKGSAFWQSMPAVVKGEALPSIGGVPLVKGGRVIGGIGCGGGSGEQDHECAVAGAQAIAGR
jgi:glc operon protein GlcG